MILAGEANVFQQRLQRRSAGGALAISTSRASTATPATPGSHHLLRRHPHDPRHRPIYRHRLRSPTTSCSWRTVPSTTQVRTRDKLPYPTICRLHATRRCLRCIGKLTATRSRMTSPSSIRTIETPLHLSGFHRQYQARYSNRTRLRRSWRNHSHGRGNKHLLHRHQDRHERGRSRQRPWFQLLL